MSNVRVSWALPTLRKSGKPLDPTTIKAVEIAISADGGQSFTVTDVMPPNILEADFTELEPGDWRWRAVVVDTTDRRSDPAFAGVVIPDESPPAAATLSVEILL